LKQRTVVTVLATLLAVLIAGCALLPSEEGGGPGAEPAPTDVRSPRPGATGESLEGRFAWETMGEYVDAIVPMITQWMEDTWRNMPQPDRVVYVPRGAAGPEDCLDPSGQASSYSSRSYEYCPVEETIYVGQDMLWEFYTKTGDAGPAVGLAHEFGHHIQNQVGVPSPRTADQSVNHENQADCIAGAWTQYTDKQGWLEYPDDIEDIDALFPLIGSAEALDRDHGTPEEREQAFQLGFERGLSACTEFYPAVPLVG
jgi:predicted metalloprotease